ncbi:hypothetical protein E2C01_038162 [Portunus trituberculatus]|uniref:Uncharacterized protein n=1 Tax=Portunus trituberculatus TaxID=210409 RepID=A0A5B7FGV8_PORTR|nr:hypothetical protein [Portunus trituberculatus]
MIELLNKTADFFSLTPSPHTGLLFPPSPPSKSISHAGLLFPPFPPSKPLPPPHTGLLFSPSFFGEVEEAQRHFLTYPWALSLKA